MKKINLEKHPKLPCRGCTKRCALYHQCEKKLWNKSINQSLVFDEQANGKK